MDGGVFKCKSCGAQIDLSREVGGVVECEFCFSKWTLPKKEASPAALSFLRQGEHDLDTCKFDDAYSAFYKAWEYDESEPEAYWGLALAEFKIQYIKDTVNNRLQPICHTVTDKNFTDNKYYKSALLIATPQQRVEYERKAKEIDYIKSEFQKLRKSGLDYDCFICVKVSRTDGEPEGAVKKNWTDDAYDADSIYDLLKRSGFTPFFSEREIRGRTGTDYEAVILYALYTSETMLVVCHDESYLQTPWVKNEYTRFLKLVNDEEKESDSITIIYNGTPIEKLPGKKGKIQGIDYSRRSADFDIVKFVENHTPIARARREEAAKKKAEEDELLRRQMEETKKTIEELKNRNPNTVTGATSTVETLLTRANQELEARNFDSAKNFFDTVLERAPVNAAAWFGLVLVGVKCSSGEALLNKINATTNTENFDYLFNLSSNYNFNYAKRYADKQLLEKLNKIEEICQDRITQLLKPEYISLGATHFYNTVLKVRPNCVEAYYALLLTSYSCTSDSQLLKKISEATGNNDYDILINLKNNTYFSKLASGDSKYFNEKLDTFTEACNDKIAELLKPENVSLQYVGFYNAVLKQNSSCAEASYALMLTDFECTTAKQLYNNILLYENKLKLFLVNSHVKELCSCNDKELKTRAIKLKINFSNQLLILEKEKQLRELRRTRDIYSNAKQKSVLIDSIVVCGLYAVFAILLTLSLMQIDALADDSWIPKLVIGSISGFAAYIYQSIRFVARFLGWKWLLANLAYFVAGPIYLFFLLISIGYLFVGPFRIISNKSKRKPIDEQISNQLNNIRNLQAEITANYEYIKNI